MGAEKTGGAGPAEPDNAELEGLLRRCAARDAAALEELYKLVSPLLLAMLLRMLKQRDRAEDVLQDAFVQIWQRANQFDHTRGRALAWLVSIARYRAIDVQRSSRPLAVLKEVEVERDADNQFAGPAEGLEFHGIEHALMRCLELLAAPQRRCLALAYSDGLTHDEIARAMDQPLGTVKSWLRRALQSLRRCIES